MAAFFYCAKTTKSGEDHFRDGKPAARDHAIFAELHRESGIFFSIRLADGG